MICHTPKHWNAIWLLPGYVKYGTCDLIIKRNATSDICPINYFLKKFSMLCSGLYGIEKENVTSDIPARVSPCGHILLCLVHNGIFEG